MALTVRPDLTEDQLIRLIVLSYGNRPRNWKWLTRWVTNAGGFYTSGNVTWHPSKSTRIIPMDDTEGIVRYYEDPSNWLDYTEDDMAAA